MKLRTKITLLVCSVVIVILLLNRYPVSMSLQSTMTQADGRALMDIAYQISITPEVSSTETEQAELETLLRKTVEGSNCTALVLLAADGTVRCGIGQNDMDPAVLKDYCGPPIDERSYRLCGDGEKQTLYAVCPIRDSLDKPCGRVLVMLKYDTGNAGTAKAQRDLDAMTILVMIIALIFVWDITDNIKGSMFNLEPVEIAQLLVERNALIDAVRDGLLSISEKGNILHLNKTAQELLSASLSGKTPETFAEVFPWLSFDDILQNEPYYDSECHIGTDSYYVSFIPIRVEKPQHRSLLVTFRPKQEMVRFAEDITGVKTYIEALRAQMHEFNNKLQVVAGLLHEKNYDELDKYISGLVHLRTREMESLSQKIHDPVLAAFIMSKYDRAAEQKVDLILTDRTELQCGLSEEMQQDMVVITGNLLENAFDAVQGCAMRIVTLEIRESAGDIIIAVWDSGMEIPQELREVLFDYGVTSNSVPYKGGWRMYRCLIVEDDPQVAKLNATYLAQEGFLVSAVAADASQALAAMEEQTFDLVLLDVFLPGMNGLELLRRLRATQQTSEVIIISAARDSAQICEALRLGCVDYIIKPFSPDRLHLALEKYRQRSLLMSKSFLEQGEVDRLAATKDDSETEQIAEYPKGIEQKTLECICENLPKDSTAFNVQEIAERTNLSRVSIKKYLDYLCERRVLRQTYVYGNKGRPATLYQAVSAGDHTSRLL